MKIEIVSASAGSGKTYKLAQILEEAVKSGAVRPDAIVATTFTNKAAAELAERVRTRLLAAGKLEEADRLAAARIGTVNSVCGRLVNECAFELGLPPHMRVLDEAQARQALDRAMSGVITQEEEEELAELAYRMGDLEWRSAAKRIMEGARSNGLAPSDLPKMARRSLEGLLQNLGQPAANGDSLNMSLRSALGKFISDLDASKDTTKKTAEAREEAVKALAVLQKGGRLPWGAWAKLARTEPAKKIDSCAEPLRNAAAAHDVHPGLRQDLERAVSLVFTAASRGLDRYQAYKAQWAVVDFVDQEVLALRLLGMESVRKRLAAEMELVLVDEFQDTSPIQIAIFLKLAELAGRCVWVGDQKQSIYGFRGTDPALMDAAIGHLLGKKEPETLGKSWRSRPGLVRLTSDLFAPAFAAHGLPESRVRIEPAHDEPPGMAPFVECWRLNTKNKTDDVAAMAAAIQDLLKDTQPRVRDRSSGKARSASARDVAVLCRTNKDCAELAGALMSIGIPAVIPKNGLIARAEAQAALAGLRLWADPQDRLARGQLARLFHYPDRNDQWLEAAVKGGHEAFSDLGEVKAIEAARSGSPNAGAISALDAVFQALDLRERCLQWGDSEQRLANLDALRAHAAKYVETCAMTGAGSTPAGLVTFLESLAASDEDEQALLTGSDAVVVSTWHAAKGLEWPVVVLYDLGARDRSSALGVTVESDIEHMDMKAPLAGRWIRYWPSPYGGVSKGIPFHDRLETDPATVKARELAARQELRLLYVGWTRARDCVVLAARPGKLSGGTLAMLKDGEKPLLTEPTETSVEWAGRKLNIVIRDAVPSAPVAIRAQPGAGFVPGGPKDHPPATVSPSTIAEAAKVLSSERVAERIKLGADCDIGAVGSAVHGFLAADRPELARDERLKMANGLLSRWNVPNALDAAGLLRASDALRKWIAARWPKAQCLSEPHMEMRMASGTIMRGIADLVVSFDGRFALVDHKSFPGNDKDALQHAASFGGQLAAYAGCFAKATGQKHLGSFVFLPLAGLIVELGQQKG